MTENAAKQPPPNTNYKTFILMGHRFSVGNDIMVKSGKGDKGADFIARLDRIHTNKEGDVMLDARWYYRPEDTKGGRQPWHGADEIIESDHKDTYHVRCVNSMAKVLGVDEYISRRQAQALEIGSGVSARKKPALKETITTSDGQSTQSIPVLYCRSFYHYRKGTFAEKVPNAKGSKSPINPDRLKLPSPKKPKAPLSLAPEAGPTPPRKRAKIETPTTSPKPAKISHSTTAPKPTKAEPPKHIKEAPGVLYSVTAIRTEASGTQPVVTSVLVGIYTSLNHAIENAAVAFRRWSADGTTRYHGRVDASALPYYIDRSALGERTGTVFETFATQDGNHTKIVVEAIRANVDVDGEPFSHAATRPVSSV